MRYFAMNAKYEWIEVDRAVYDLALFGSDFLINNTAVINELGFVDTVGVGNLDIGSLVELVEVMTRKDNLVVTSDILTAPHKERGQNADPDTDDG